MRSLKFWAGFVLTLGIAVNSAVFALIIWQQDTFATQREVDKLESYLIRIERKVDSILKK